MSACAACLARPWLLARMAGHLDNARDRTLAVLELDNAALIAALGGGDRAELERELAGFDATAVRHRAGQAGLELICRCADEYPAALAALGAPPAVLHIKGGLARFLELASHSPVAVVGARRGSPYGISVASSLGRGLAAAGVTVISGMARGIDAAAHHGALAGGGDTIAVLAAAAEIPYPASAHGLHRRIVDAGAVVSELPPGTRARRWMFPARNRIIAALAAMTVVVEAREASGALITAQTATELDRRVGAVPGQVTSPLATGTHRLLRRHATLIRGPEDVLDAVFGAGGRTPPPPRRPALAPHLDQLLEVLAEGHDVPTALGLVGMEADGGLAALAALELAGRIRRQAGGRFTVVA